MLITLTSVCTYLYRPTWDPINNSIWRSMTGRTSDICFLLSYFLQCLHLLAFLGRHLLAVCIVVVVVGVVCDVVGLPSSMGCCRYWQRKSA